MIKLKNLFTTALLSMLVLAGFSSCSEDNPTPEPDVQQTSMLPQNAAIVLNEGTFNQNNAGLMCFDYTTDKVTYETMYKTLNNKNLGDTGQDIIVDNGNIYLSVHGSNYIAVLNKDGKETARFDFNTKEELGAVRHIAADNNFIYASSYGGYVSKFNKETLELLESTKVGNNPECITFFDGKIYCMNSGYGKGNTMSVIDTNNFSAEPQSVEIFGNPQQIKAGTSVIFLQGYGGEYPNFTYPVEVYNPLKGNRTQIGQATQIDAYQNTVYCVYSQTDWNTMTTQNTIYSYNADNSQKNENLLKNAPEELYTTSIYGISVNHKNGDIYILTTQYSKGDGTVYHFNKDGKFVNKFSSYGQCPKKVVFL